MFTTSDCWCVCRGVAMRNAMFFPNRILYREELLSTTVTYAVDLSETEFLHLKPIVPIEQLGIRPTEFRLYEVADRILERYAIHELHYLASVNADIQRVQYLVENWDYREVGISRLGVSTPVQTVDTPSMTATHRCVALAFLLLTHSITYQPVTAITAITQTETRHRVYEDEYSQTR